MNGFGRCSPHEMVNIECRTVKDHISAKDTGLDVECSLEKGLICQSNNGGKECEDFEIRVLCGCGMYFYFILVQIYCNFYFRFNRST